MSHESSAGPTTEDSSSITTVTGRPADTQPHSSERQLPGIKARIPGGRRPLGERDHLAKAIREGHLDA